eukprot:146370_1
MSQPCHFFNTRNGCRHGSSCRYSHDISRAQTSLCRYFNTKNGCRYGSRCRYKHKNDAVIVPSKQKVKSNANQKQKHIEKPIVKQLWNKKYDDDWKEHLRHNIATLFDIEVMEPSIINLIVSFFHISSNISKLLQFNGRESVYFSHESERTMTYSSWSVSLRHDGTGRYNDRYEEYDSGYPRLNRDSVYGQWRVLRHDHKGISIIIEGTGDEIHNTLGDHVNSRGIKRSETVFISSEMLSGV